MAIAYDTISTTSSTTNTTSLSLNHTASGSDRLAVVIYRGNNQSGRVGKRWVDYPDLQPNRIE